jgi:plastocyanin
MQRHPDRLRARFTPRGKLLPVLTAIVTFSALCAGSQAESITGTILIKRQLTKRRVTPDVSIYQRGTAVELGRDANEAPLDYERARVVIYLEGPGPAGTDAANPGAFKMEQINRRFLPDLLVVQAGSTVSFPNMDPVFHNIFSLSKPKSFDLGSYDKGDSRQVVFPKPGIVEVFCHLHPNMAATILVAPNRWYVRSDRTGQYRIPDVVPGKYTVVAWHKAAGFFRKSIVVEPGHDSVADFFVPIDVDPGEKAQ